MKLQLNPQTSEINSFSFTVYSFIYPKLINAHKMSCAVYTINASGNEWASSTSQGHIDDLDTSSTMQRCNRAEFWAALPERGAAGEVDPIHCHPERGHECERAVDGDH